MAKNIISERWTAYAGTQNPVLAPGRFGSPIIEQTDFFASVGILQSVGNVANLPNGFFDSDTVLIRRARFWSPLCGLGLVGGAVMDNLNSPLPNNLNIYVSQQGVAGKEIHIYDGMVLGEWVDINMSLGAVGSLGTWGLRCTASSILLDSSRIATDIIGSALLNFHVQIDIAHTLEAIVQ